LSSLRIATYNVHSSIGNDGRSDRERVLKVLKEIDADILGLQEVGATPQDEAEQFNFFKEKLKMEGVAGPTLRRNRTRHGNVVLTRGHIRHATLIDLTVASFAPRGAIDCSVEIDGHTVRVIATHLGLLPHERQAQLGKLAEVLGLRSAGVTVVLGDFNIFGPERMTLQRIGAPAALPKLRSFPARRPIMSLDRIWTIPNRHLQRISVHQSKLSSVASDHLPLVAEIEPEVAHDFIGPRASRRTRLWDSLRSRL
jgi:endonuclease/exonuclease/phosphatase family metal-dependent hydrolase